MAWSGLAVVLLLYQASCISAHGRLLTPPGRSSAWRYGFDVPPNYSDNQLFCGGFQYQQNQGGKCGVCGDPYKGTLENEAGGKYATGVIVGTYGMGEVIDVMIQITASHKGFVEFRLCVNNDVTKRITQECLDQNLLASPEGVTQFPITEITYLTYSLQLPPTLECSQCVLQWRYHTGNSWGTDPDGTSCLGCGPQEEFYACSDIAIQAGMTPMTVPNPNPTIPAGNDPNMTDYEDWDWDTTPGEEGGTVAGGSDVTESTTVENDVTEGTVGDDVTEGTGSQDDVSSGSTVTHTLCLLWVAIIMALC